MQRNITPPPTPCWNFINFLGSLVILILGLGSSPVVSQALFGLWFKVNLDHSAVERTAQLCFPAPLVYPNLSKDDSLPPPPQFHSS